MKNYISASEINTSTTERDSRDRFHLAHSIGGIVKLDFKRYTHINLGFNSGFMFDFLP